MIYAIISLMILYCVRHGQTDFNKNHIIQGIKLDEPLNVNGERQIRNLIAHIPNDFEVLFSSSLRRVLSSADMISQETGKQIIINDDLTERDFGSLAGKTWDDIPNGRDLQKIDREQKYDYREYGGESVEDVKKRIESFLDYVKKSGYKKVLVVTSVGIIRLLYLMLKNENVIEIDNASVHIFEI